MRIGIDARMFGKRQTGIGAYIKHLIFHLLKNDSKNEYVIFLLNRKKPFEEFEELKRKIGEGAAKYRVVPVGAGWYGFKEQTVFPFQLLKEKVDLMHFPHFNVPILYFKKFIVTIHDLTPKYFPGHKMNSLFRRFAFWLVFKNAVSRAKKVIAVSNYTKKEIMDNFKIPDEKIRVVYEGMPLGKNQESGIPPQNWRAGKNQESKNVFLRKHNITKPYILYIGVWRSHKNLIGLIRAFDILLKQHGLNYQLVLGGAKSSDYPEIEKMISDLKINKNVITPGFIKEEDLPLFYQYADLVVIPSFYEGFGFVGIEAAAFGVPVVASNTASLPEILNSAALYFNPSKPEDMADVMNKVLTDERLRTNLIKNGHENIKRFSFEKMTEETMEIYSNVSNYKIGY